MGAHRQPGPIGLDSSIKSDADQDCLLQGGFVIPGSLQSGEETPGPRIEPQRTSHLPQQRTAMIQSLKNPKYFKLSELFGFNRQLSNPKMIWGKKHMIEFLVRLEKEWTNPFDKVYEQIDNYGNFGSVAKNSKFSQT